jgi:hypothetical protein
MKCMLRKVRTCAISDGQHVERLATLRYEATELSAAAQKNNAPSSILRTFCRQNSRMLAAVFVSSRSTPKYATYGLPLRAAAVLAITAVQSAAVDGPCMAISWRPVEVSDLSFQKLFLAPFAWSSSLDPCGAPCDRSQRLLFHTSSRSGLVCLLAES